MFSSLLSLLLDTSIHFSNVAEYHRDAAIPKHNKAICIVLRRGIEMAGKHFKQFFLYDVSYLSMKSNLASAVKHTKIMELLF